MKPCLLARMVNQVGEPGDVEGRVFFPETGMPIWEDGTHQDVAGGLIAGAIHGGDLDAEIVDNLPFRIAGA